MASRLLAVVVACDLACALAGALLAAAPARAAEDERATSLAQVFASLCVGNDADFDRVSAAASSLRLQALDHFPGVEIATPEGGRSRAWRVVGAADVAFALAVSQGRDHGRTVGTCVVADPSGPGPAAVDALHDRLKLGRPFRREPEAGRMLTFWDTASDGRKLIVVATETAGGEGVSLAATAIARP